MRRCALLLIVTAAACGPPPDPSVECKPDEVRRGDECVPFNDPSNDANNVDSGYTCVDVCEKRLEICGFREFDGDFDTCLDVCDETPAGERNEACFVEETCVDIAEGLCNVDSANNTGGGGEYDAYTQGDGPFCGEDSRGFDTKCEPGDNCIDPDENRCGPATGGTYQSYTQGDGPFCGEDSRGFDTKCEPGDSCVNENTNTCASS